jgi:hypothetical protein
MADIQKPDGSRGTGLEAHLGHVLPDLHALPSRFHDEGPHIPGLLRIHPGEDGEAAGVIGIGDVRLHAVEDIVRAVFRKLRRRLDVPGVGTRLGFREGVGKNHFAGGGGRQIPLLLILRSEKFDPLDADKEMGEKDEGAGHIRGGDLLHEPDVLEKVDAQAAVSSGNRDPEKTRLPHLPEHLVGDPAVFFNFLDRIIFEKVPVRLHESLERLGFHGHPERMEGGLVQDAFVYFFHETSAGHHVPPFSSSAIRSISSWRLVHSS